MNLQTLTAKINTLTTRVDAIVSLGTATRITIAGTAPSSPSDGDLWIDTSSDNVLKEYTTALGWTAYQFGTSAIADAAVTGALIAGNTITAANIASATITTSEIATGTIIADNIASGTITSAEISGSAGITGSQIGTATITGSNIAGTTITASNIASGTITATQISGSAGITGSQIGTGTITATNIAAATITAAEISGTAAITGSQLASGTITATQIASGTITSAEISGTAGITGSQIASATIQAGNIASGTITATQIQSATITNTQIAAGTITGSNIGSSTITAGNIADATITNVQISDNTITTTQISNSAGITGTQIATGTVTDSNLVAGTITAASIASGTITASLIASHTITAAEIDTAIVIAGIVDGTTVSGAQLIAYGTTGQLLIYSGTPSTGNLIGSWSGEAGTDSNSNDYPTGLKMTQGSITGVAIDDSAITSTVISGGSLTDASVSNPQIDGGTATSTDIEFNTDGGILRVYTSSTTSVTQSTAGDYSWTVPSGTTVAKVECWGGGAGGDGGTTSEGGNGGGGGEYARVDALAVTSGATISYTVGSGGAKASTGTGHGEDGGDSFFNGSQVIAHGGSGNGAGGTGSTNSVHYDGGAGGASSGSVTGGASGGNSGCPTAAGNDGSTGSGTTHGAAPASQTDGGQGGAGGDSGSNASDGSGPGGAGGGAGAGSSSIDSKAIAYVPVWQETYYGPDATGTADGARTSNPIYQGGETSGGGSYNGTMRSVIAYNRSLVASDFSGYTITQIGIQLKNTHSWYSSGMSIELGLPGASVPGSAPSSFPDYSWSRIATVTTGEYETHMFGISTSHASQMVSSTNAVGLGCNLVSEGHDYELSYYGYFDPSQTRVKFWGTSTTSGSTDAGAGADGRVKITYTTGRVMVCAIASESGSDGDSNAYGAGYTGDVNAFEPGSDPKAVEGWHYPSPENSWSNHAATNALRYRYRSDNQVQVQGRINGGSATSSTFLTLPTGYRPAESQGVGIAIRSDWNAPYAVGIYAQSTGPVQVFASDTTPNTDLLFNVFIPLDT